MKLWAGRLSGDVNETVNALNASIGFDGRMVAQDIRGSIAHAAMLSHCGVLTQAEGEEIAAGLTAILADVKSGKLPIDPEAEDIHTFVEAELTARTPSGKKLHTARSRNDQVATDLRLFLSDAEAEIIEKLQTLALTLCQVAEAHTKDVMPGYTHLQRAQPVTLGHHLMAYVWMFLRDMERIRECRARTLSLPLGSGALAGTTYPLDREYTAELLGFTGVCENSMDGVSDRDFAVELACDLSMVMMHLSRMAEELILWCSWEFRFLSLSDSFSTGSSIMPQKKNPDVPELLRGKTARVYGDAMTLLTMMKGLPLAYNKDLQEDKEAIFDAVDTVSLCLAVVPDMIKTAVFHPENMKRAAARGFINATDCADYLTKRGMAFRDAYRVTGELVRYCMDKDMTLETLPLEEYKTFSPLFQGDVYEAIDLLNCVKQRKVQGGPAPEAVLAQIEKAKALLQ